MPNLLDRHIAKHKEQIGYYPEGTAGYEISKCALAFFMVFKNLENELRNFKKGV